MKKIILAAALALVVGGTAQAAMVDYAAVYGGATIEPNLRIESGKFSMDTGYNVGGALGWNITPEISVGVDAMFTSSDYSGFPFALESFSLMATGYYSFDVGQKWRPFVGIGVGEVHVAINNSVASSSFAGSQFVFGYEGMAGVTVPIASKVGVLLAYKYQGANDASIASNSPIEYKSNNLSVGLVFDLN